jgi:hypothetical protein
MRVVAIARTSRTLPLVRSMTALPRLFRGHEQPYGTDISARKARTAPRRHRASDLTNGPAHDDEAMVRGTRSLPGAPKMAATGGAWGHPLAGEIGQS